MASVKSQFIPLCCIWIQHVLISKDFQSSGNSCVPWNHPTTVHSSFIGQVVPGKDIWKYIHGKHLWLIFWSGSSALFFGAKCGCGLFLKATAAVETRFEDGNGREENSSSLLSIADCSCVVCTEKGEEELLTKKAWIWKPMEVEVTGSC